MLLGHCTVSLYWAWRSVRYDLYSFEKRRHNRFVEPLVAFPPSDEVEAPWQALHIELADSSTAQQAVGMMQHLGSVVQTAEGEWPREQYEVSRTAERRREGGREGGRKERANQPAARSSAWPPQDTLAVPTQPALAF